MVKRATDESTALDSASSPLWPGWADKYRPPRLESYGTWWAIFKSSVITHAEGIYNGAPDLQLTDASIAVTRRLVSERAPLAHAEIIFSDWFDRLVWAGNEEGRWWVALPPPRAMLPRESGTLVRDDYALRHRIRPIENDWWARALGGGIEDKQLGDALLVSAVLQGGLMTLSGVNALLSCRMEQVSEFAGRLRISLQYKTNWGTRSVSWFPDSLTASLLARGGLEQILEARKNKAHHFNQGAAFALKRAITTLGLPPWNDAAPELMRAIRVSRTFELPPYVVAYASGVFKCASLPPSVFRRINTWAYEESIVTSDAGDQIEFAYDEMPTRIVAADLSIEPKERDQRKIIKEVMGILRRKEGAWSHLGAYIAARKGSCWPLVLQLLRWIHFRLDDSALGPKLEASSSAVRYLGTLWRPLLTIADTHDPMSFEVDDFEFLYESAADRIKSRKERQKFWGRLRDFHSFLASQGAPPVDFQDLDGYLGSGSGEVVGNLVSEQEYSVFRDALLARIDDTQMGPMHWSLIAGMLGFRCGLRRREIQMLLVGDLHPGPCPMLVIRSSRLAQLKTASAERRIPLRGLVPEAELAILLRCRQMRAAQLDGMNGLLFAQAHSPLTPLPSAQIFDPVTQLFQAIVGNQGQAFRFHHLRHSFANWTLLALLAADNPALIDASAMPWQGQLPAERIAAIRETLFPQEIGCAHRQERRNLYQLSYLLGHLSPGTSLKHYVHVMDWIAGQEVELALGRALAGASAPQLARLCGLSRATAFTDRWHDLARDPLIFLRSFVGRQVPDISREQPAPVRTLDLAPILDELQETALPHPALLILALAKRAVFPENTKSRMTYGISERELERAEVSYLQLYAKQSRAKTLSQAELPCPPRNRDDLIAYRAILAATFNAFRRPANRNLLAELGRLLLRRVGPRTSRLYPGNSIVKRDNCCAALRLMGIPDEEIQVTLRSLSSKKDRNYMCSFAPPRGAGGKSGPGAMGRIRGLNHAAVWLAYAIEAVAHAACEGRTRT